MVEWENDVQTMRWAKRIQEKTRHPSSGAGEAFILYILKKCTRSGWSALYNLLGGSSGWPSFLCKARNTRYINLPPCVFISLFLSLVFHNTTLQTIWTWQKATARHWKESSRWYERTSRRTLAWPFCVWYSSRSMLRLLYHQSTFADFPKYPLLTCWNPFTRKSRCWTATRGWSPHSPMQAMDFTL